MLGRAGAFPVNVLEEIGLVVSDVVGIGSLPLGALLERLGLDIACEGVEASVPTGTLGRIANP